MLPLLAPPSCPADKPVGIRSEKDVEGKGTRDKEDGGEGGVWVYISMVERHGRMQPSHSRIIWGFSAT